MHSVGIIKFVVFEKIVLSHSIYSLVLKLCSVVVAILDFRLINKTQEPLYNVKFLSRVWFIKRRDLKFQPSKSIIDPGCHVEFANETKFSLNVDFHPSSQD